MSIKAHNQMLDKDANKNQRFSAKRYASKGSK